MAMVCEVCALVHLLRNHLVHGRFGIWWLNRLTRAERGYDKRRSANDLVENCVFHDVSALAGRFCLLMRRQHRVANRRGHFEVKGASADFLIMQRRAQELLNQALGKANSTTAAPGHVPEQDEATKRGGGCYRAHVRKTLQKQSFQTRMSGRRPCWR